MISERGGWTVKSKTTVAKTSNQTAAVLHYVFGKLLNFVINVYDGATTLIGVEDMALGSSGTL